MSQIVNPTPVQDAERGGFSRQASDRDTVLAIGIAIALIVAIQSGVALNGISPVLSGGLVDTDDYMRLVRVEYLWQSGAWFDAVIPRIDPPNGLALHWTRPMDILLLAGAGMASPFLGFHGALFWWGAVINPILMVISLCAVIWAAAPLIPRTWLPLVAFVFVSQPGILERFMIGRADHHGLLIFLFIVSLGYALRVLTNPERKFDAAAAGLTGALAIWVSIESLVAVFTIVATFGLCWLLGNQRMLRALTVHSAALCVGLALALLVERGPMDMPVVEVDKISILHLVLFGLSALTWWGLLVAEKRGWVGDGLIWRAIWVGSSMSVSLLLLWSLFPQVFANPMETGGDLYQRKHLAYIQEIQPLIDVAALQTDRWAKAAGSATMWLGIAIPTIPWIAYRLWRCRGTARQLWLLIAIASLAFVPLTLYQLRWVVYAETVLVIPYADLAAAIAMRLSARFSEQILGVVRPFLFAAMCTWVFVPSATVTAAGGDENFAVKIRKNCPIQALSSVLNVYAELGDTPKRILAMIDFGPEILYRTRHSVLSIPNHRPQQGFTVGYRAMTAVDFQIAQELLVERRVDLVAICLGSSETLFYDTHSASQTLFQALRDGTPPDFLVPVPLPDDTGGFRLFAVQPTG